MSRDFPVTPTIPPVQERMVDGEGRLTTEYRRFFEDLSTSVFFEGEDLVKGTADTVDSLSTDYYTKTESDAKFATISTTYTQTQVNSLLSGKANTVHTHAASDITSGTLADARIPALAISKVTGLQASLDGKVDESAFGTVTAGMTLTNSHYLDLTLPGGQVFRIHGELLP